MNGDSSPRYWRTPFDAETHRRPPGKVVVLEERCKGCAYCVEFCPRQVLDQSARFNLRGYHPPDIVNAEACAGCGLCELLCPEFAIAVEAPETMEVRDAR